MVISIGNIMKSVFLFCRFDILYLRGGQRDCSNDEGSSILCLRNDIPKPFSFFKIHHMSLGSTLGSKAAPAGNTNIIWNASCQLLGRSILFLQHCAALYLIIMVLGR